MYLTEAKPHLPTIDLHSLTTENEDAEVIAIFQRPYGYSLQVPEVPDSLVVEGDNVESLEIWNVENYLKNLKENANSDKDRSHLEIMERLVAFSKSQVSQSLSKPVKSPENKRELTDKCMLT